MRISSARPTFSALALRGPTSAGLYDGFCMTSSGPQVELRWWRGCPSTPKALEDLGAAMAEHGLDPEAVRVTEIRTDDEAESVGFAGSPTILIDGLDVQPPGDDNDVGLSCRIYRTRDGRISPTPDPDDIRDALTAALARRS
jgi:hypothetical protein